MSQVNMEVDEVDIVRNLNVWFFPGGTKPNEILRLTNINYVCLTVDNLKKLILEEDKKQNGILGSNVDSVSQINLIFNGKILRTLSEANLCDNSLIQVVKVPQSSPASATSRPKITAEKIKECALSLRATFVYPTFIKTIQSLTESNAIRNLFAVANGLESDLIGIGILQSPHLLFQLVDREILTKVADSRPWLIEALNYITATVLSEKNTNPSRSPANLMISQLLNSAFDGEDDDSDEDEERQPSQSRSAPNMLGPITREQLTQALRSIPLMSSGSRSQLPSTPSVTPGSSNSQTAAPLGTDLSRGVSSPLNITLPGTTSGNTSGTSSITGESVARAMQEAFSHLSNEERQRQYEMLRQVAQQIMNNQSPATPVSSNTGIPGISNISSEAASSNNSAQPYQSQLAQLRELGITDERISLLALRVSDGDVETAAELIFSGWDGSGAEPESSS